MRVGRGISLTLTVFLSTLVLCGSGFAASSVVGVASVIDGDTIEIHGIRIRLHGIDAPEDGQLCQRPSGEQWRCGQRAAFALADYIGPSTVRCDGLGHDRYKRLIAVCFARDEELNRWLVSNGWAVAFRRYSLNYVTDEHAAREARLGLWSSEFEMPWEWRQRYQRPHNR